MDLEREGTLVFTVLSIVIYNKAIKIMDFSW